MTGLMYTASFSAASQAGSRDLFNIIVPSPDMVILHSIRLGQRALEGDADAEMLEVSIARSAAPGAGTANTPSPHMNGAPAASSTVVTNATPGTPTVTILFDVFNLQAGWLYLPTPEERLVISSLAAQDTLLITVESPSVALEWSGSMTFEEILG